ncbi:toll/interleukin-1 receptor domain-containing protein [Actinomadura sp. 7K507]|uniref:toll/interleukin-1 receptor domain-containing protein n=1 Tax=Actinomadura sp. 7K507 TaxID=2530365 RepID=UPI001404CA9E|nr:toll/interleukin-1 receptor domain-containing protein [Actinomadura sp. 7K507]
MPIFISYSHYDSDFVDKLAMQLVQRKMYVWLDRWELQVGDSLLTRIEAAITTASALLVILSVSSVDSPWCRAEINAGLMRELKERKIVVLPILIEDCDVPIFLQDKIHADFRADFDAGLRTVMEATAGVTNAAMSRTEGGQYYTDWSLDWGEVDERVMLRVTFVQQAAEAPYTILSTIVIIGNDEASKVYGELVRDKGEEQAHISVLDFISGKLKHATDTRIRLSDQFERGAEYMFSDGQSKYYVETTARRLGVDTGRDVLVAIDEHLVNAVNYMKEVVRQPGE